MKFSVTTMTSKFMKIENFGVKKVFQSVLNFCLKVPDKMQKTKY